MKQKLGVNDKKLFLFVDIILSNGTLREIEYNYNGYLIFCFYTRNIIMIIYQKINNLISFQNLKETTKIFSNE